MTASAPQAIHAHHEPGGERSALLRWAVLLPVVVGFLARWFRLGEQSLWVDEIFTWHNAEIGGVLSASDVFSTDHGPLLQVILHLLGGWFGDSEFVLRMPSVIAGTLTVVAFAGLAARLLGREAAVPAAWCAALSPFLVWYGQEARNYSFAILFSTATVWAAVVWKERGGWRRGVVFTLCAWLGILSNLNVLLLLPVLLVFLLWPRGGQALRPAAVLGAFLALAMLEAPWIWDHVQRLDVVRLVPGRDALPGEVPLRHGTTFTPMGYPFTAYVFSVGYTLGPPMSALHTSAPLRATFAYWPVLVPSALLFGWLGLSGLWALRRRPRALWLTLAVVLVPTILVTYFAVQNFKVFNPRYVSSGLAGYYLILVAGWLAQNARARLVTATGIALLWSYSLLHLYFDPQFGREDFRAATVWLDTQARPGDQLLAAGNYSPLDYYWQDREPPYDVFWLGYSADPPKMRAKFEEQVDPTRRTWVVVSRPYLDDLEGRFEAYLGDERDAVRVEFSGVRVYRLSPEAP